MQRLQFFPEPYPDESLYSIFCRYFVRSAEISHYKVKMELFGANIGLTSLVLLPRRLHLLDCWLPENSEITRKMLIEKHTAYPYMSIFYPADMIENMNDYIALGQFNEKLERSQIGKNRNVRKDFLCFCPACTTEDINTYGEAYWHRLHQIQGVLYCPKHQIKIEESVIPTNQIGSWFRPASSFAIPSNCTPLNADSDDFVMKYMKIAEDIEWLLEHGLTLGGAKTIGEKYKDMYLLKGDITTRHGRVLREHFEQEIESYYGKAFLDDILNIGGYVNDWHKYACASMSDGMRPLHQLLIMNFLCDSPKGFRDSVYEYAPFGHAPWPCINKHCPHFGIDGINEVEYGFSQHCHIGYFKCEYCGMHYRRSKDDQSFDEYSKHAMLLDYGHLWEKNCEIVYM